MNDAKQEASVREMLGRLTIDQLNAGLKRGEDQLALLSGLEAIDESDVADNIGHPGRHAKSSYQSWACRDMQHRRMMLSSAIADTRAELNRRGEA